MFRGPLDRHGGRRYYKDLKCPRNLYYLIQNYLKGRKAVMATNNLSIIKTMTRGSPRGRGCCGPGLWNIQYDTVFNLHYKQNTRVIAFADDFLVMI